MFRRFMRLGPHRDQWCRQCPPTRPNRPNPGAHLVEDFSPGMIPIERAGDIDEHCTVGWPGDGTGRTVAGRRTCFIRIATKVATLFNPCKRIGIYEVLVQIDGSHSASIEAGNSDPTLTAIV